MLAAEPRVRHVARYKEVLGFVTCITTASFEPARAGTRLIVEFESAVAGGPIGRVLQSKAGGEIVVMFAKDAARLKALAESVKAPGA